MPAPLPKKLLSVQNPKSIVGSWLFTMAWCGISFTVFWAFAFGAHQTGGAVIGGLFSLLGLVMLYGSIQMTLEYFKYGRIDLKLEGDPFTGGNFGARLELPGDAAGATTLHAELVCVQTTWTRGSKGAPSKGERDVWSGKSVFPVRRSSVGSYATMKFDVPGDQPASDMPEELPPDAMVEAGVPAGVAIDHSYYRWELRVKADVPGIDLDRIYKLRVARGTGAPAARPSVAMPVPPRFNPVIRADVEQRIDDARAARRKLGAACAFIGFVPFVAPFAIAGLAIGLAGCPMGWKTGSPPQCEFAGINWGPLMSGAFDVMFILVPVGIVGSAIFYFLGLLWLDRRHKTDAMGGKSGLLVAVGALVFVVYQAWQFIGPFKASRTVAVPVQSAARAPQGASGTVPEPETTTGTWVVKESDDVRLKEELALLDERGDSESPAAGLAHYRLFQLYERQKKTALQEQELLRALAILESHTAADTRKALRADSAWLDKEIVARRLGDFYWDQRNYPRAYDHYDKAYRYVPELQLSDAERNRRLARNSAGRMAGACTQGDWAVADQAMRELKERIAKVDEATRTQLEYWIRTGEPRLAARKC